MNMHPYLTQWREANIPAWKRADLKEPDRPGVKQDYVPAAATNIRETLNRARREAGWPEVPR